MIIRYSTIRMMDKVGEKITENFKHIRIERNSTIGCCIQMQKSIDEINKHDSDSWSLSVQLGKDKKTAEALLVHTDYDGNDYEIKINNCPFCGMKIESEEVKVMQKISEKKCKQVTKTECENLVTELIEFDNTSSKEESKND